MIELNTIITRNEEFNNFLITPSAGVTNPVTKFSLEDIRAFMGKVNRHNRKSRNTKVANIGVYNTLHNNVITSFLVGLDSAGNLFVGGGGGGDSPPHHT